MLMSIAPKFTSAQRHLSVPDVVLKAKSIFIANQTGNQDVANGAYAEFMKWGRFSVVNSRKDADLIVILTRSMTVVGGASTDARIMLIVTPPDSNDPIWQTPPMTGFHTPAGYAKEAVDKFKEWTSRDTKW
jgi:pantothenate kinase